MWSQTAILGKGFLLLISLWNGFSPACARLREVKLPFWVKVFVRIPHTGIAYISYISRTRDFRFQLWEQLLRQNSHRNGCFHCSEWSKWNVFMCSRKKKKCIFFKNYDVPKYERNWFILKILIYIFDTLLNQ